MTLISRSKIIDELFATLHRKNPLQKWWEARGDLKRKGKNNHSLNLMKVMEFEKVMVKVRTFFPGLKRFLRTQLAINHMKSLIKITFRSITFRMTFGIYEIPSLSYKLFVRERHTKGFGVMQITPQFIIPIVRLLIRKVAQKSHLNCPNLLL